jgi:hypothetical protein
MVRLITEKVFQINLPPFLKINASEMKSGKIDSMYLEVLSRKPY